MRRRGSIAVLLAAALLACSPATAGLLGRPAADREKVQPLRDLDLAAVLSGAPAGDGWREAAAKLPKRCASPDAAAARECDDDLRCAWLAARAAVADAWSGADRGERERAASALHLVADRLLSGRGLCGKTEAERRRWEADRRAAALDDARASLALLVESPPPEGPPVLPGKEGALVARVERAARERGLAAVGEAELVRARPWLPVARERRAWLRRYPLLARLRSALPRLWEEAGGLPAGCGRRLLAPDLLEDQWRGYLVREVTPAALDCLRQRLLPALERRPAGVRDAEAAARIAADLSRRAAADAGGRRLAGDPQAVAALDRLIAALRPGARVAGGAAAPAPARARTRAPRPAPAARPSPAARRPAAREAAGAKRKGSAPPAAFVALVREAGALVGDADRWERAAGDARSAEARARLVRRLVVELHRRVCRPIEAIDPDDLAAAAALLAGLGRPDPRPACAGADDEPALAELARTAPDLMRLTEVARLRRAARLAALDHAVEALRLLDRTPREWRGLAWSITYAWAARRAGDPVAASRALARVPQETIDRLRASGDEALARFASQAWAP